MICGSGHTAPAVEITATRAVGDAKTERDNEGRG